MVRRNPASPRLVVPESLDDVLLYRMARVLATAGTIVIRLCEGRFGITRREWRLIALLARQDDLLSSELAQRARLDRARTSRAVTSLCAKKLIRRVAGPADRREVRLSLTDSGRKLYSELFPLVLQVNRELLSPLTASQLHVLDAGLDELELRAEAMVRDAELPKANRRRGGRIRAGLG